MLKINSNKKDLLIVSFAGLAKGVGNSTQFEFLNFLEKHFDYAERHFYMDIYNKWYHNGIENISNNIESTVTFLSEQIKDYKNVIFIGSSCGGYAAILYGSLLNINTVIAFRPQTIIPDWLNSKDINLKYSNLNDNINNITNYYIYGDINVDINIDSYHHISQCYNIKNHNNVFIFELCDIDLRKMRDSGELLEIFNKHIKNF